MSEVKVNKISPRSGTDVTLGDSGDTFTIPSGATIVNNGTQTGFGRTGTVNWQTGSIKTGDFTAANGEGYFVNTTSGAVTATLPSSPAAGNIVAFKDYAQTFATNNLTINRNSQPIEGVADNITINGIAESVTLVYVDATRGWVLVNEATSLYGPAFVEATGGTITTTGNFKVHTFTGPGTFTVTSAGNSAGSQTVDYFVVAGGGGGAGDVGGAGGGGGFRLSNSVGCIPAPVMSPLANPTGLPVSVQGYPITVGGGGAGSPNSVGCNGVNSVFSTITSAGGGGGAHRGPGDRDAGDGGSGGGGVGEAPDSAAATGGVGNTPPVSPPQGNNGGDGDTNPTSPRGSGGGGGAGAVGGNTTNSPVANAAGDGGDGSFVSPIMAGTSGTTGPVPSVRYFAGGGGGGTEGAPPIGGAGTLGRGGAGGGGQSPSTTSGPGPGFDGTTNTGGGASGASRQNCGGPSTRVGGSGGSGIVMIRYKFQG